MKKQTRGKADFPILVMTIVLVLFGCIMIYSASYYTAIVKYGTPGYYFFLKQLVGAVLGCVAMLFFMNFNFQRLEAWSIPILIACCVMLIAVFIPGIGKEQYDSARWIDLGFVQIQPAEITKFAIIIYLSSYFARNRDKLSKFWKGVFPALLVIAIPCGLILAQPNFSMLLIILMLVFIMMFLGGVSGRQLGTMGIIGVAGAAGIAILEPYRIKRIFVFLDPWKDTTGNSYQLIQSFYAIGSGGLFGKGLGRSQQKYLYLPYGESDFIFGIIAEELGLIGVIAMLLGFLVIIWRGIRIALLCPNRFGSLLAGGITAMLAVQVLINIAVATGVCPPTGQTLPFISYGSSSLIIFMSSIGVLLNISRSTTKT